ncbi:MAG: alpha/beta hydrolase [Clostridiaceae bacterium]
MKQYDMKKISIGNETLAYRASGAGETIVLIHGNMSSSVHWQTTMEHLEGRYHVVAPDMRGFGDSTYNSRFDSLRELAQDLERFLDEAGIDTCTLVGWSTGGGVVLEMAADLPARVKNAILVESVPPTGYPMFKKDASGQPILSELLKTKQDIEIDPVQVAPVLAAYASGDREMMRAIWNAVIYNRKQPPAEDYELYLEAMLKQKNLVDIDYSLLTFNMTDKPTGSAEGSGRLAQLKCPVTLIHGMLDLVVPCAWAEGAQAAISGSSLVTLETTGHSPITDDPALFFATLDQALTK